ncbi:hypothetical protein Sjap_007328 [Stephania japonica]|uniref:Uncharacterized protein n=1 Tax=Stephania japonica TaxID=461633 RepID=A0AAP0PB79_9MAGN
MDSQMQQLQHSNGQRAQVEKLLNPIADHVFEQMLLIAQHITDYSVTITTHVPYRFEFYNDEPITAMEDIEAYYLLIRPIHHRPYHIYCNVSVSMISKFFHDLAFRLKGSDGFGELGEDDQKVIDTLSIFTWVVVDSLRFWGFAESAMSEIGARPSPDHNEVPGLLNGGFVDSENALRRAGTPTVIDVPDHDQRRFLLRKDNGDRLVVDAKANRGRDQAKMLNEGERSSSLFHLVTSIFRRKSGSSNRGTGRSRHSATDSHSMSLASCSPTLCVVGTTSHSMPKPSKGGLVVVVKIKIMSSWAPCPVFNHWVLPNNSVDPDLDLRSYLWKGSADESHQLRQYSESRRVSRAARGVGVLRRARTN